MKELYEEITEVKFYHDPFKGYADNYILGSEEVFVDKAKYKEENIICNSFDELWNYASEKSIRGVSTKKRIYSDGAILL